MTLRPTRFDVVVISVMLVLVLTIGLTLVFGQTSTQQEEGPRVAYLKRDANIYEVWMTDPENPRREIQLTDTAYGVFDYDVSADGRYIAYSAQDPNTGLAEIYLVDLRTQRSRQITDCSNQESYCSAPKFQPGGNLIAYQRRELNLALELGASPERIWLLDLGVDPIITEPLFDDTQILGYGAEWSDDGERLAFYEANGRGIMVYDFTASEAEGESPLMFVPSDFGTTGALSPDGSVLVYPEMIVDGNETRAHLQIAELDQERYRTLSDPAEPIDDQYAVWSPDGRYIAIQRRYRDDRFTVGGQIYLLDLETEAIEPMLVDADYAHTFFRWSPDGSQLVMQRFPVGDNLNAAGTHEVWIYDLDSDDLRLVNDDARNPLWVPENA